MTDIATKVVNAAEGVVQTLEDDFHKVVQWVEDDFTYLKTEATVIWNWAEKSPVLQPILKAALTDAEAAAKTVAEAAEGYLSNAVTSGAADVETLVANFLQAIGVDKSNLPANLTAAAGDTISYVEDVLTAAIKTAIPKVLAVILAPAPK